MSSIKPTVGRIVHFFMAGVAEPMAAVITAVVGHAVHLAVFMENGTVQGYRYARLLQDGDARPNSGWWAEWMPYQKGQAAKTEALEKRAAAASHLHQNAAATPVGACGYEFTADAGLNDSQKNEAIRLLSEDGARIKRVSIEMR